MIFPGSFTVIMYREFDTFLIDLAIIKSRVCVQFHFDDTRKRPVTLTLLI